MRGLIGDRTKSALDEMEEVARERNRDVAEEERLEALTKVKEAARRAHKEENARKQAEKNALRPEMEKQGLEEKEKEQKKDPKAECISRAKEIFDEFPSHGWVEKQELTSYCDSYWIYRHSLEQGHSLFINDSASMAMLDHLLNGETSPEYAATLRGIRKFFPRKRTFFRGKETYYPQSSPLSVLSGDPYYFSLEPNALMAVMHLSTGYEPGEAPKLLKICEKNSRRHGVLFTDKSDKEGRLINKTANALMAIAYAGTGNKEKAAAIFEEMDRINNLPIYRDAALMAILSNMLGMKEKEYSNYLGIREPYRKRYEESSYVYTSALFGCAFAVIGGKELFPKNGGSI